MSPPVFLFPGQGSQVIGMGKSFYDANEDIRRLYEEASSLADVDLAALSFSGPMETLTETKYLQPAMMCAVLASLKSVEEIDTVPSFVAGHSLGEYAALVAGHVISENDCLRLVVERGRLMHREAEKNPGAMMAVLKLEKDILEELVAEIGKEEPILVANYNAPTQLVVSGSERAIDLLDEKLKTQKARGTRLKVSGAWHSPLMKGAEAEFNALLDEIEFDDAKFPILLNTTGQPATDGQFIKDQMKKQMCSSVLWYQGILEAWKQDARIFVELGPKGILTRMLKTIVPESQLMESLYIDSRKALESYIEADLDD